MNKSQLKLLQKSVDNIRLEQIQAKVNLEAEINYARNYIGSPMPVKDKQNYFQQLVENYKRSKVKYLL